MPRVKFCLEHSVMHSRVSLNKGSCSLKISRLEDAECARAILEGTADAQNAVLL